MSTFLHELGPMMVQKYVWPAYHEVDIGQYKWSRTTYRSQKSGQEPRKRPLFPISNMTAYEAGRVFQMRSYSRWTGDSRQMYSGYQAELWRNGYYETHPLALGVKSVAASKMFAKMKDVKFDASLFIAELPETRRWLAQSIRSLTDMLRWLSLRKANPFDIVGQRSRKKRVRVFRLRRRDGSFYSARLALDNKLANRYAEWRFAASPIIRDVDDLITEIAASGTHPLFRKVSASEQTAFEELGSHTKFSIHRLKYIYGAYFTVTPRAAEFARWGGLNLPSLLWELTPYSFMVDRFIPIGDWLARLDAELGVSYVAKWETFQIDYTCGPNPAWVAAMRSQPAPKWVHDTDFLLKIKSTDRRLTGPTWDPPRVKPDVPSVTTLLDALALARLRLG